MRRRSARSNGHGLKSDVSSPHIIPMYFTILLLDRPFQKNGALSLVPCASSYCTPLRVSPSARPGGSLACDRWQRSRISEATCPQGTHDRSASPRAFPTICATPLRAASCETFSGVAICLCCHVQHHRYGRDLPSPSRPGHLPDSRTLSTLATLLGTSHPRPVGTRVNIAVRPTPASRH